MPTTVPLRVLTASPSKAPRKLSDATVSLAFAFIPIAAILLAVALRGPHGLTEIGEWLALGSM